MADYHEITMRHVFQPVKGMLQASCDYQAQEARVVGALSKDPNLTNIFKLLKDYETKIIPLPLDPKGNPYKDPRCVSINSEIITREGFTSIKLIKVGTEVLTRKGYRKVKKVLVQGQKSVNRYYTSRGYSLDCTSDHKVLVFTGDEFLFLEIEKAKEQNYSIVLSNKEVEGFKEFVPLPEVIRQKYSWENCPEVPKYLTEELAEFLGRFIADGSIHKGTIAISLGDQYKELKDEWTLRFKSLFNLPVHYHSEDAVFISSTRLALWIKEISGKQNAREINLSTYLLISPNSVKKAFIRQYIDSDGYVGSTSLEVDSICKELIYSLQRILLELGIISAIREYPCSSGVYFRLTISDRKSLIKYQNEIGLSTPSKLDKLRKLVNSKKRSKSITLNRNYVLSQLKESSTLVKRIKHLYTESKKISKEKLLELLTSNREEFINPDELENLLNNCFLDKIANVYSLGSEEVIDLSIEDCPEFICGGIVVHNCDLHIMAGCNLHPEVKRIVEEEPWLADPATNPLIKEYRFKGKTLNYSVVFLISEESLAEDLKTDLNGARQALNQFFGYPDGFYMLGRWLKANSLAGAERKWIRNILGGTIFCNEGNAKGIEGKTTVGRKAVNSQVQSCGAMQSKIAFLNVIKAFDKLNDKYRNIVRGREACVLNVVHDRQSCRV